MLMTWKVFKENCKINENVGKTLTHWNIWNALGNQCRQPKSATAGSSWNLNHPQPFLSENQVQGNKQIASPFSSPQIYNPIIQMRLARSRHQQKTRAINQRIFQSIWFRTFFLVTFNTSNSKKGKSASSLKKKTRQRDERSRHPKLCSQTEREKGEKFSVVAFVVVVYRPAPVFFTRLRISGDVDFVQTTHVSWFLLCRHRNGNQVASTNDTFWREDSSILFSSSSAVHGWGWTV